MNPLKFEYNRKAVNEEFTYTLVTYFRIIYGFLQIKKQE